LSKEKPKPYTYVVLISIIIISVLSIGIFITMSGKVQRETKEFSEVADILDNFGNLAIEDIDLILQEDSIKYDESYSTYNELVLLNRQYFSMIEYNLTHPNNYTQKEFDAIKMDFSLNMRLIIDVVQSSIVYDYSTEKLGCNVANNYTYHNSKYFFIINQWNEWNNTEEILHPDILNYANSTFDSLGMSLDIPEIKFKKWAYHLDNNLSILQHISTSKSINYITHHSNAIDLDLVNLSLETLSDIKHGYISVIEKSDYILSDINNSIVTLALAGVLMGFAISFDNSIFRKISLFVGLAILILAIVYFVSAFSEFLQISEYLSTMIKPNDFVNF
jgi:hypothetical protein